MTLRPPINDAVQAAMVDLPQAMAAIVRAEESEGPSRLNRLLEAQQHLYRAVMAVNAAIAAEVAKNPRAAPVIGRIREAASSVPKITRE